MCGIVGAVAQRDVVPILVEGLKRLEYRGYDSAGRRGRRRPERSTLRRRRQASASSRRSLAEHPSRARPASPTRAGRRTGDRATRTRTRTCRRRCRGGAQRDHREPRGAARELAAARLRVRFRDRHRGHRATWSTSVVARARACSRPCGERVRELEGAYAIAVISRDDPGTLVVARRGARSARRRRRRELRRLRRLGAAAGHAALRLSRGRRLSPSSAATVDDLRRRRQRGRTRARTIRALGATRSSAATTGHYMQKEIFEQPRAVADTLRGPYRAASASRRTLFGVDADTLLSDVRAASRSSRAGRATTPVSWRATGWRASPASRAASRSRASTATAGRSPPGHAVRGDLPVGRDGRHARRDCAHAPAPRLRRIARDLQRAGVVAGARSGPRVPDARRSGDRRRVDQGVHDAARGARAAGARARAATRAADSRSRARCVAQLAALPAAARRSPRARDERIEAPGREVRATSATRCSSAAASTTRSRWRAR